MHQKHINKDEKVEVEMDKNCWYYHNNRLFINNCMLNNFHCMEFITPIFQMMRAWCLMTKTHVFRIAVDLFCLQVRT